MTDFKTALGFIRSNKIKMLQRPKELHWLFNRIKKLDNPRVFVEIGSGQGASAFILGNAMPVGSSIYMIDKNHPDLRLDVATALKRIGYDVREICGDSVGYMTKRIMEGHFEELEADILFIDGDHSYEGVKADFEYYSKFVRKGGLIALHDIARHPKKPDTQVWQLWKELKEQYNTIEYIEKGKHVGVGVVIK